MDSLFKQMLSEYEINNPRDRENAIKQIIQEFVLCGLSRSGFFEHAAFCGGTALRIFYDLDRFSEDLDFSLTSVDKNFKLEKYFPMLIRELNSLGVKMEVQEKIKTGDSHVQSAFVKGNTRQIYLLFYTEPNIINRLHRDSLIRVKFEIDTCPPPNGKFEYKTRHYPYLYQVRLHDLPSLFAGKLNALIARKWRNRIKGRDFYDFIFYINKNAKFNLKHLEVRLKQSEFIDKNKTLTLEDVKQMLYKRFDSVDYEQVINDVKPFVKDHSNLKLWNAKYFKSLVDKLECE